MDEVVAKYKWTADELIAAQRWHYRHGVRRYFRVVVWGLIIFLVLAGILVLFAFHDGSGVVFIAMGLLLILTHTVIQPWLIRRNFRHRPDNGIEIEWHISTDRLQTRSTHGASEMTWKAFGKVVQSPDGFLLYPFNQLFFWLPRHGFTSDADYDRLARFAQQSGVQFHAIA